MFYMLPPRTYPVDDYVAALEASCAPVGDEDEVADVDGGRHGAAADGAHGRVRRPGHPEGGVRQAAAMLSYSPFW